MRLVLLLLLSLLASASDWPQFRGPAASGTATGANLPDTWNVSTGQHIRWKTPIPGLAHSSPVVWGDRIFVTTAVSSKPDATFKRGLYGAGTASDDLSMHKWQVLCLDRKTGRLLWTRTAYEGVPKEKRHIKSTYASSTPVTDGKVVVAFFGSQGIHGFSLDGKPLWSKDLGRIDAGAYDAPEYEWGTASSPILFKGRVFVQVDQQKGSFLIALDSRTGETVWKTERDQLPSWATPAIVRAAGRNELVTNAPNSIQAYDPESGKPLWSFGGSSKITAPTPIAADGVIIVASGRRPEAPIFAVKAGSNGTILWQKQQRGPYMPTPILLDRLLYVLGNAGVFDCYVAATGEEVYRQRIPHLGSGFSASPVAADGRIFLPSEDGDVFVVQAGREFKVVATNNMGEPLMATPALSGGLLLIRGQNHLFAIGR
jgi:outer membrane protein assembly factor BamB